LVSKEQTGNERYYKKSNIYINTEASISSLVIRSSYEMPLMVFLIGNAIGILEGHLFWRMKRNKDTIEIDNRNFKE